METIIKESGYKKKTKYILFGFFYTLVLVSVSSLITYAIIFPATMQQIKIATSLSTVNRTPPQNQSLVTSISGDVLNEQTSALDNEINNESTGSASVILHGSRDTKQIALTFDAEMTGGMRTDLDSGRVKSSFEKRIIDTLSATQTKATIFLTGMWIELYPNITKQLAENSLFEIGSHSYADYSFSGACFGLQQLNEDQQIEQVGATELLLKLYAGMENKIFRFPGGCYSPKNLDLIHSVNDIVVHWDVNGNDGFNNNTGQIVANVVNNVQNGSIIILHINGAPNAPKTADALPVIIQQLKAKGYQFVKISELLNFSPELRVK